MDWDGRERRGDDHSERIAVLESKIEAVEAKQNDILKGLQTIHTEMTKYKGFLGGVVFLASGVVTLAVMLWDKVLGK